MSLHSRTVRTARAASDPYLWGQNGATEQTFIMIKPDAVGTPWLSHEITTDEEGNEVANDVVRANDKADAIKDRIEKEGFTIVRQRRVRLSKAQAQAFYAEHEGREFF
jgi:nucleoside diphosphate kinase